MTNPDFPAADSAALSRLPRCACGAHAMAFRPGTEPERQGDILSIITGAPAALDRGEPGAAWCEWCWSAAFLAATTPAETEAI